MACKCSGSTGTTSSGAFNNIICLECGNGSTSDASGSNIGGTGSNGSGGTTPPPIKPPGGTTTPPKWLPPDQPPQPNPQGGGTDGQPTPGPDPLYPLPPDTPSGSGTNGAPTQADTLINLSQCTKFFDLPFGSPSKTYNKEPLTTLLTTVLQASGQFNPATEQLVSIQFDVDGLSFDGWMNDVFGPTPLTTDRDIRLIVGDDPNNQLIYGIPYTSQTEFFMGIIPAKDRVYSARSRDLALINPTTQQSDPIYLSGDVTAAPDPPISIGQQQANNATPAWLQIRCCSFVKRLKTAVPAGVMTAILVAPQNVGDNCSMAGSSGNQQIALGAWSSMIGAGSAQSGWNNAIFQSSGAFRTDIKAVLFEYVRNSTGTAWFFNQSRGGDQTIWYNAQTTVYQTSDGHPAGAGWAMESSQVNQALYKWAKWPSNVSQTFAIDQFGAGSWRLRLVGVQYTDGTKRYADTSGRCGTFTYPANYTNPPEP